MKKTLSIIVQTSLLVTLGAGIALAQGEKAAAPTRPGASPQRGDVVAEKAAPAEGADAQMQQIALGFHGWVSSVQNYRMDLTVRDAAGATIQTGKLWVDLTQSPPANNYTITVPVDRNTEIVVEIVQNAGGTYAYLNDEIAVQLASRQTIQLWQEQLGQLMVGRSAGEQYLAGMRALTRSMEPRSGAGDRAGMGGLALTYNVDALRQHLGNREGEANQAEAADGGVVAVPDRNPVLAGIGSPLDSLATVQRLEAVYWFGQDGAPSLIEMNVDDTRWAVEISNIETNLDTAETASKTGHRLGRTRVWHNMSLVQAIVRYAGRGPQG